MDRKHHKLNEGLDPDRFCIRLETKCRLILDDYAGAAKEDCCEDQADCDQPDIWRWYLLRAYLRDLGLHVDQPNQPVPKHICLTGRDAINHAWRVHAKIRRQLLRFDNVTAVDVGFAVQERQKKFTNCLAIRIHVGIKHPVSYLRKHRLPDPTNPHYVQKALAESGGGTAGKPSLRYPIGGVVLEDLGYHCCPCEDAGYYCCPSKHPKIEELCKAGAEQSDGEQACASCHRPCHCRCEHCHACCICCCCDHGEVWCDCWPPNCRLTICGVPLDVIEANYFPSTRHPGGDTGEGVFVDPLKSGRFLKDKELILTGRGKVNPLVGGVSVGSVNGQAGTLGVVVWDETDGSPCALGNWHVLAGSATAQAGQPCYQPALFDGGCRDDVIGHLKRWHLGELGDAALAELDGSRDFASGEILGLWHPISGHRPPELNLEVRKWGRTTGFTEGFIDGIHLATDVDYGAGFVRHFEHQFHIAPLFPGRDVSQIGDSGSLVVTTYNLDVLEDIARGMLRRQPPDLVTKLQALIKDGPEDLEALASEIRTLLKEHPILPPEECKKLSLRRFPQDAASDLAIALKRCREEGFGDDDQKKKAEALLSDFKHLLGCILDSFGVPVERFLSDKREQRNRRARNVYYAVGMIFAGDTPGSPFGEFALASDISRLAEDLRFSLRPVFEPRSSFRKLRSQPPGRGDRPGRRGIPREPGAPGADPRGQGPQPEGETLQSTGPGTGGGGG